MSFLARSFRIPLLRPQPCVCHSLPPFFRALHTNRPPRIPNTFFTSARRPLSPLSQPIRVCGRRPFSSSWDGEYNQIKTVIWGIVGINTAVFLTWQYALPSHGPSVFPESRDYTLLKRMNDHFLLSARNLAAGNYDCVIGSAFSHIQFGHFIANMVSFYSFGIVLASCYIPVRYFLALCGGSLLSSSFVHLAYNAQQRPGRDKPALGASGMVSGVGAAAALLAPRTRFLLFGIVPAPLWALVLGYAAFDAFMLDNERSNVGHSAHLGGLLFGAAFYMLRLRRFGGVFGQRGGRRW